MIKLERNRRFFFLPSHSHKATLIVAIVTHDEIISKIIDHLCSGRLPVDFENKTKDDPSKLFYKNTSVTSLFLSGNKFTLDEIGSIAHLA